MKLAELTLFLDLFPAVSSTSSGSERERSHLFVFPGLPSTLERGVDPAVMSSMKSLTSVELAAAMGHRSTPRYRGWLISTCTCISFFPLTSLSLSFFSSLHLSSVLSSLAPSLATIEDQEGRREGEKEMDNSITSDATLSTHTPAVEEVSDTTNTQ